MATKTYSFMDVRAAISAPDFSAIVGGGNGVADEGITVSMVSDKNVMTIGADGGGMHSLVASRACTVTMRLLRTNPVSHLLSQSYNYQSLASDRWGGMAIIISNPARGDLATIREAAFRRVPDFVNSREGGIVEWVFDAVIADIVWGDGQPDA